MLFVATLSHDPEDCWVREENRDDARRWIAEMDERADRLGVEVRGAYVTPNEHTFYVVLEADGFEAVSEFLGPPFLEYHDGHVAPVLSLERGVSPLLEELAEREGSTSPEEP